MRTTLTLDPDVAFKLKRWMKQRQISLKQAVNEALRRGLSVSERSRETKFRVEPHPCHFRPGVDPDKMNQLADQHEVEAARTKLES